MGRLLIHNIGLLATPEGEGPKAGLDQGKIRVRKDAWILIDDETIVEIGEGDRWISIAEALPEGDTVLLNAGGRLVTPGLVDAHTHLVFGGFRQNELGLKLHGATYLDILAAGGGILSTVRSTRAASFEELYDKAKDALDEMLTLGITSVEAKSGYGLDRETELKQLEVIRKLKEDHDMDIRSTFLGARESRTHKGGAVKVTIPCNGGFVIVQ